MVITVCWGFAPVSPVRYRELIVFTVAFGGLGGQYSDKGLRSSHACIHLFTIDITTFRNASYGHTDTD